MFHESNCTIAVIGIDIGRNPFHVVGHDQRGAIVLRQKWSRGQVEAQLANLPRATSAIPRTLPGRTAKSVWRGSFEARHRAANPGEDLWRSAESHATPSGSIDQGSRCGEPDQKLLQAVARAHAWLFDLTSGNIANAMIGNFFMIQLSVLEINQIEVSRHRSYYPNRSAPTRVNWSGRSRPARRAPRRCPRPVRGAAGGVKRDR
jgi:hypothetical protein